MTSDSPPALPGVGDSPWFWLALFAGMSLVSLLLVQSKFAQRQARIEQRFQNQLAAQQARLDQQTGVVHEDAPVEAGYDEPAELPEGPNMRHAQARTSLVPLMGVAGLLLIVGLVGLFRQRAALAAAAAGSKAAGPAGEAAQ